MDIAFSTADVAEGDLLIELMREFYAFEHLAFDEQVARSALRQILSNDALGRVWLIRLDGHCVGYAVLTLGFSLEFGGRDAFLDEIYIRAEQRWRGVGSKALEFIEEACRTLGVRALHLEVERENRNAQAVYRKFGFKEHDRFLLTKWIAS
jgi:diamine N-acetyltransferase